MKVCLHRRPWHRIYLNWIKIYRMVPESIIFTFLAKPKFCWKAHIPLWCAGTERFGCFKFFLRLQLPKGNTLRLYKFEGDNYFQYTKITMVFCWEFITSRHMKGNTWNRKQFVPKTVYSRLVKLASVILQSKIQHSCITVVYFFF